MWVSHGMLKPLFSSISTVLCENVYIVQMYIVHVYTTFSTVLKYITCQISTETL